MFPNSSFEQSLRPPKLLLSQSRESINAATGNSTFVYSANIGNIYSSFDDMIQKYLAC